MVEKAWAKQASAEWTEHVRQAEEVGKATDVPAGSRATVHTGIKEH